MHSHQRLLKFLLHENLSLFHLLLCRASPKHFNQMSSTHIKPWAKIIELYRSGTLRERILCGRRWLFGRWHLTNPRSHNKWYYANFKEYQREYIGRKPMHMPIRMLISTRQGGERCNVIMPLLPKTIGWNYEILKSKGRVNFLKFHQHDATLTYVHFELLNISKCLSPKKGEVNYRFDNSFKCGASINQKVRSKLGFRSIFGGKTLTCINSWDTYVG